MNRTDNIILEGSTGSYNHTYFVNIVLFYTPLICMHKEITFQCYWSTLFYLFYNISHIAYVTCKLNIKYSKEIGGTIISSI